MGSSKSEGRRRKAKRGKRKCEDFDNPDVDVHPNRKFPYPKYSRPKRRSISRSPELPPPPKPLWKPDLFFHVEIISVDGIKGSKFKPFVSFFMDPSPRYYPYNTKESDTRRPSSWTMGDRFVVVIPIDQDPQDGLGLVVEVKESDGNYITGLRLLASGNFLTKKLLKQSSTPQTLPLLPQGNVSLKISLSTKPTYDRPPSPPPCPPPRPSYPSLFINNFKTLELYEEGPFPVFMDQLPLPKDQSPLTNPLWADAFYLKRFGGKKDQKFADRILKKYN